MASSPQKVSVMAQGASLELSPFLLSAGMKMGQGRPSGIEGIKAF